VVLNKLQLSKLLQSSSHILSRTASYDSQYFRHTLLPQISLEAEVNIGVQRPCLVAAGIRDKFSTRYSSFPSLSLSQWSADGVAKLIAVLCLMMVIRTCFKTRNPEVTFSWLNGIFN
jgi:hypothetical protein